ncbi:MAG: bifunctional riboflavin kinase/FAD synthetase [Thermodesulfobacteriota bacterium]
MKVIKKESSFRSEVAPVVTLGNFDGIHLGHQKILSSVVKRAQSLNAPGMVYTFDPHPLKVVAPHKCPPLILGLEDKIALVEASGIDFFVLARFTRELAALHPRDFAEEVLAGRLGAREVCVGKDFSFGRGRSGDISSLKEFGGKLGFSVRPIPPCTRGGLVVSSSRIRGLILAGEVKMAAALLGRPFFIRGRVVPGDSRGRELGFPTANIEPLGDLIPSGGVYAGLVTVAQERYGAIINIGSAPTFGGDGKTMRIEAHILGFSGDIYGSAVSLQFIKKLRDEKAFGDSKALIRQIKADRSRAEKVLHKEIAR